MTGIYLVRYGMTRQIGRFAAEGWSPAPGDRVVIQSIRGTEPGEVVLPSSETAEAAEVPTILRPWTPDDDRAWESARLDLNRRFDVCRRVFEDGDWPILPLDVEPLLDPGRTVLHYLGPHKLDVGGLNALLREKEGLELHLEPVGKDEEEMEAEHDDHDHDHDHGCGSGGCGSCGSEGGGCGTSSGGCSSCGIKELLSRRQA